MEFGVVRFQCDGLPEGGNVGGKVNEVMRSIEKDNPQLARDLPKTYEVFSGPLLKELLKGAGQA